MRLINLLLFLCLCLGIGSPYEAYTQKRTSIEVKKINPLPSLKGELMAGAASFDITPPPGFASGARSKTGVKNMLGFRTRLKSRVFCIRDKEGTNVAIVQLDLAFGSLIMHHQIAEAIADKTDIPIQNIVLTCTHTHSGPTGYCGNDFYNKQGGAKPGFEPTMYHFLKDQIIAAILEAHAHMRPAKIATGKIDIHGFTRNRAISAYVRNEGKEDLNHKDPTLIFEAINPTMYMLRVDVLENDTYQPLGAFSTFSVHGTGIGDKVDVFNADVFAYAQRDLEWQIKAEYNTPWDPVHAFCNGTEGDVAPNLPFYKPNGKETKRVPVDWLAARGIGQGIGQKAWELFQSLDDQLKDDVKIQVAVREIDISENNVIDDIKICRKPTVGPATMGGAYENRSLLAYIFNDGTIQTEKKLVGKKRLHGEKRMFLNLMIRVFNPPRMYPRDVMFQLIQIDDFLLVPLPWEVTTTAGQRMAAKITAAYQENNKTVPKYIAIASLSNDYLSYATTPEEYSKQLYEGGQTIYGKNTTPYITAQLYHLTNDLIQQGALAELPNEWKVNLKTNAYAPKEESNLDQRKITKDPALFFPDTTKVVPEAYWKISWVDVMPKDIQLHKPIVYIEKSSDKINWSTFYTEIQPITDEGYDIEVRLDKKEKGTSIYSAKWYNPEKEENSFYRFVILPRNETQEILYSAAFK